VNKLMLILFLLLCCLSVVACDVAPVAPTNSPEISTLTPTATLTLMPSPTGRPVITPETEFDQARETLFIFFDTLYREDYQTASLYYHNYATLRGSSMRIDAEIPADVLKTACTSKNSPCEFYCWPVKDIMAEKESAPGIYVFDVRFEKDGVLLSRGSNRTPEPCTDDDCVPTQFTYYDIC
jgi:hypothetical protein